MQVFNTFFKVAKKYRGSTIMYIVIFLSIVLTMAANSNNSTVEQFKSATIKIAVFDHDHSTLSTGLTKYINEHQNVVEIQEDLDSFKDNLYSRAVEYVLIIPEGFEKNVVSLDLNTSDPASSATVPQNDTVACDLLTSYKLPGSLSSEFLDMQINKFISTYNAYTNLGYDGDAAYENTNRTLSLKTEVTLSTNDNTTPASFSYYRYMPYILLSILTMGITPILIVFNKTEMKKRTIVSCVSQTKRNLSLGLASLLYTIGIFLFFVVVSLIMYKGEMLSSTGIILIGNMFVHILICLSFSFFMAQILVSSNVLNMITNIFGLGSSFLSGVFVPKEFLSPSVLAVGHFFPAYWYISVEEALLNTSSASSTTIITGFVIQLLFAVAFFTLGMGASQIRKN